MSPGYSLRISAYLVCGLIVDNEKIALDEVMPEVERFVVASKSLPLLRSISSLWKCRKSAPIIAFLVSARMNFQLKARRRPRLTVIDLVPNVLIIELLAAYNLNSDGVLALDEHGIVETSDPESIKNLIFVIGS